VQCESRMKLRRQVIPVVLSALFLAGCKFQAITTIEASGAGELRTEIGFTPDERQRLEAQSGNAADFCATERAPTGMTVTEERRGDETWCVTISGFGDLDELRELYAERAGVTINRLELTGDRLYYDIDIDTSSKESNFSTFSSTTWTIVLPGALVDHNATQQIGDMLVWELMPRSGMVRLRAESRLESGSSPETGAPILGLLGLLVVIGMVFLARRWAKK